MALQSVKATDSKTKEEVFHDFDFGADLDDAVAKFGADVVFSLYKQKAVISLQSIMRQYQNKGLTQDQITDKLGAWKPGVKVERTPVDIKQAAIAKFAKMTDAEKAEFLAALQAQAGN